MDENKQNTNEPLKPFSNSNLGLESMPQEGGIDSMRRSLGVNEISVGYRDPKITQASGPLTPEMIGDALMASGGALIKQDEEELPLAQKMAASSSINNPDIKPLRTYKTDVEEAIKNQRMSVAKIASSESLKKENDPVGSAPTGVYSIESIGRFIPTAIISGILVAIGVGAVYFVFIKDTEVERAQIIEAITRKIPIEATKKKELPLTFNQNPLIDYVTYLKSSTDLRVGDTLVFEPVIISSSGKQRVTTSMLFSKATPSMPQVLLRSLDETFVLGANELEGTTPFIILFTKSFDNAFSGMLDWEKFMPLELSGIVSASGDTSTQNKVFYDKVVKNKDARVLKNISGQDILFYTFANKETIVITTKQKTLEFLIDEITKTRVTQ